MNLKQLLSIVKTELKELTTLSNPEFRLGQVEPKHAGTSWEIIVSFLVESKNYSGNQAKSGKTDTKYERLYKKIILDEDKKVTGIFIYNNK